MDKNSFSAKDWGGALNPFNHRSKPNTRKIMVKEQNVAIANLKHKE